MRKLALGLALLLVLLPGVSGSLGLGNIKVDTALNQPLRAEIQLLSIPPGEVEDIKVSLARKEVFDRLGIERPFVLNQLRFKITTKGNGETVISVLSNKPIKEPFLNFLVEVEWPKGRLLREYTVLLDPPLLQERRAIVQTQAPYASAQSASQPNPSSRGSRSVAAPSPAVAAASEASPTSALGKPNRVAEQSERVEKAHHAAAPAVTEADESMPSEATALTYQTQPGDTLGKIAREYVPDEGVGMKQMMIATLRENPNAFVDGNINNLKAGYILRIPDAAAIESVSRAEAVAEVSRQYALWREYRAQMVSQPTQSQAAASTMAEAPATESVSEEAEVGVNADDESRPTSDANLEILASEQEGFDQQTMGAATGESVAELQQNAALAQELAESRQQQNEELKARVGELEAMLAQQERIINLQTEELAKLQQQLAGDGSAAVGESLPGAGDPAQTVAQEETILEDNLQAETESSELSEALSEEEFFGEEEVLAEEEPFAESDSVVSDAETEFMGEEEETFATDVSEDLASEFSTDAVEDEAAAAGGDLVATPAGSDLIDSDATEGYEPQAEMEGAETSAEDAATQDTTGVLEGLLAGPMSLVAMAGAGLLLVAMVWLLIAKLRRGKQEAFPGGDQLSPEDFEEVVQEETVAPVAASDAGAVSSAEMSEDRVLTSAMDPAEAGSTGAPQAGATSKDEESAPEDQAAGDDVLSEADVYIAYGLYQQAEDLLKDAIEKTPGRTDYRFKLLEAYFGTKNIAAFDGLAKELYESGDASGELWSRAVAMGKDISPENPLYTGVDTEGIKTADFAPSKPQVTDIDLGAEDSEFTVPDLQVDADANSTIATDLSVGEEAVSDAAVASGNDTLLHSEESPESGASDQKSGAFATGIQELDIDASELERSLEGQKSSPEVSEVELSSTDDENLLEFDVDDLDLDLGVAGEAPATETSSAAQGSADEEMLEFNVADLEIDIDPEEQSAQSTQQLDDTLDIDHAFDETIIEPGDTMVLEGLLEADATEIDLAQLDDTEKEFGKLDLDAELADDVMSPSTEMGAPPGSQVTQVQDVTEQVLDTEQFDIGDADTELLGDGFNFDDLETATAISDDADISDAGNEIDTKLDLAKAFLDMGDSDGARSTLEEVVQDGDNDQRQAAESLLKQIA